MGSAKGSTKQESTQTNNPPPWATPLLIEAANKAMNLYKSGKGYNVYRGPTQAQFSPQRLEGLNNAMKMTGSTGPQITNESVFNNPAIQQARAQIKQQMAGQQQAAQQQQQQGSGKYTIPDFSHVKGTTPGNMNYALYLKDNYEKNGKGDPVAYMQTMNKITQLLNQRTRSGGT